MSLSIIMKQKVEFGHRILTTPLYTSEDKKEKKKE
jgi:hypothetical protein